MSSAMTITMSSAHSPTFPSLHIRHSSFSSPSVALPTSQLILQPFRCFTYVTSHSPTPLSLLLRRRLFTYVTWRAAHGYSTIKSVKIIEVLRSVLSKSHRHLGSVPKGGWSSNWIISVQIYESNRHKEREGCKTYSKRVEVASNGGRSSLPKAGEVFQEEVLD